MKLFKNMNIENNILNIGGLKVTDLTKKYTTPLYVMDINFIEERIKEFKDNFKSKHFKTEIIYASKAFLCKGMCKIIKNMDTHMDAVSGGELYLIKHSNFDMQKVHMHGNNKTYDELLMCFEYNIGCIIIDNYDEARKIVDIAKLKNKKMKVMIRVNVGIDAHTHEYIKTSKHNSKFGVSVYSKQLNEIIHLILKCNLLEFLGFQCHIGSQIFEKEAFLEEIKILIIESKKIENIFGIKIRELDIGGGFGVYYTSEDKPIPIKIFMEFLISTTEKILAEEQMSIEKLYIEPGRSIIANAGCTIYSIGGIKETYGGTKYIFVDGGMSDNIRPCLYQAKYEAIVANRASEDRVQKVTVAGKCCESGDVLIKDYLLQKCEVGDFLVIFSTGAYGYSMASNYNKIPRPAVIFIKDGKDFLAIKRESYDDLIKLDINY